MAIIAAAMMTTIQSPLPVVNLWTAFFLPFPSEWVVIAQLRCYGRRNGGGKSARLILRSWSFAAGEGDGSLPPALGLEVKTELGCVTSWSHEVRATKRGQKIIESNSVCDVDRGEPKTPLIFVGTKKIVVSDRNIEEVARSNARRIVIVVLSSRRRYFHAGRTVL